MTTLSATSVTHYKTYQGQASSPYYKERAAEPHYMGYSYNNTTSTNRYCTSYGIQLPTFDGTVNSITFTMKCIRGGSSNIDPQKTYKIGLANDANNSYPTGEYNVYGLYTGTFTNSTTISTSEVTLTATYGVSDMGTSSSLANYLTSGKYFYAFFYSGAQQANWLQLKSLSVSINYTPTTYYAKVSTNSNSNATSSVSPSSGTKGTSVKFSASSSANTVNTIYSDLKLYVSTTAGGSTAVARKTNYAQGLGTKISTSYSTTFRSNVWYYAKATATSADPGDVNCTVSNITSTSAKIYIPDGITTTFLDSYYYISSLSNNYYSSNFTYKIRGARSNKYVDISGLTPGTNQTWYVFAYNSYNNCYYKIGSVNFTTDASSYNMTASVLNIGSNSATVTITSGPTPTTNLDGYWYLSTSTDSISSSLAEVSSGLRTSDIDLINLKPETTISRSIYVYSNISKRYYKAGSITFETTVLQYSASLIVTGITESQANITLFGLTDSTNLDSKYYLSKKNEGLITNSLTIHSSEDRGRTIRVSNLIPGRKYEYYCYLHNTYDNNYYYVGSVKFITYSTIVYIINENKKHQKCRLYIYDSSIGEDERIKARGLIL